MFKMCHRVLKSFHLYVIHISSLFLLLLIPSIEGFMRIFVAQISQWVKMPNACQRVGVLDSHYSQSYGFSSSHVQMWELVHKESWKIDAFELWCWRRLLRVPWTARRSNQSVLKKINPEYSLEGLMLKWKLQYFGHLMWIADSLEKILRLGNIEGIRRMRW